MGFSNSEEPTRARETAYLTHIENRFTENNIQLSNVALRPAE